MAKNIDDQLNTIEEKVSKIETDLSSVKTDIGSIKQEIAIKHNEQMNKLDSIAKMLETDGQERIIAGGQIDDLRDEMESLKKIHPDNQHSFATN